VRDGSSTTEGAKSAEMSPLRLRVGVFLILLWIVPFWALAPYIAHSLSGVRNPPSVAAVTTTILVVQTIIGLLGFWVAGAAVKSIIKGSTMRHALGAIWSMLIHGDLRGQGDVGSDPNERATTRGRLAASLSRTLAVPERHTAASLSCELGAAAGAYVKSVQQMLGHASPQWMHATTH
jgi:hypothetical protein